MSNQVKIILFIVTLVSISCSSVKYKNVNYTGDRFVSTSVKEDIEAPILNIFKPKNLSEKVPILIFVHGGNWNKGSKEIYWWFGRNFARKNILTILPGYTLSPNATYDDQASQIATAIKWIQNNAHLYGGDVSKVYVTGHSAGGHLVALAVMNPKYNIKQDEISGIILNDAAGLDMAHYLKSNPPTKNNNYVTTWTKNPKHWKDASPINFINKTTPPILSYLGKKTYPSIKEANNRFREALVKFQPEAKRITLDKKHVPMMTQYILGSNKRYDEILDFIEATKN
ncbi:alpha/beta hydrolase [Dokdonia sp. Hel_I_53]|uniref:alpha/beta hydrolase n=1 Tax=Dokdonia sp. Hel_I_53 TaxID=1566287 RepID=UPI001199BA18|nr:alpha/beta hydrolase [Dokdonia sp. Hel_I_53]TVZ53095.1 carboxylesterase family protein [Dokdonia sp. Hel_I_53]